MVERQLTESGIKVFSEATIEELEQSINTFLTGDNTAENPRKVITQSPSFAISGGSFYAIIVFNRASSASNK